MSELKGWFVGVDWASENHRVRIADCYGKRLGERDFAHGGAGLAEMATWLMSIAGAEASAIHVAIEVPHGPIVETLLERGFNVYAINPKQLDRFRDRFSPAGAKDDSRDAEVLADALRTKRSGKSCIVTRRLACNPRLRNALRGAARCSQSRQVRRLATTRSQPCMRPPLRGRSPAQCRLCDASQRHPIQPSTGEPKSAC